jgi:chorismate-pyruvate lyase
LPPVFESAASHASHDRFLYLFDESFGKYLREHPEVERRVQKLAAEIFEALADGLREMAEAPPARRARSR